MLWQVLIGSGENHRMGLYDMVMVKDNHTDVAGGIENAIVAVNKYIKEKQLDVGVEVPPLSLICYLFHRQSGSIEKNLNFVAVLIILATLSVNAYLRTLRSTHE
jgi:hypothetical protein